ncbi:MAG: AAA family ATPase [Desulfobacterales bacterium]|jgi:CO dehydrogenase maturation factor|nr:AAA family ATPase [Desulfobacterales bacterium]
MINRGEIQVIAGKGGVGKTSVSAIFTKLLLREKEKLLIIDADPMVNLGYALGEIPERTIGDYREKIISSNAERKDLISRPIKAVIRDIIKSSDRGYDLLAMGRAEGKGCFCGVNDMLRYGIQALSKEYDLTLIDCEAGVEQVNRRAVHRIDKLVLVTDTSRRGFATLAQVRDIATKYNEDAPLIDYVLVNRIRSEKEREITRGYAEELGFVNIGFVPEDDNILVCNTKGQPLIDLPDDSPSVLAVQNILQDMAHLFYAQSA